MSCRAVVDLLFPCLLLRDPAAAPLGASQLELGSITLSPARRESTESMLINRIFAALADDSSQEDADGVFDDAPEGATGYINS